MAVVLGDALVKPVQLAQRVADRRVGPAGQILQVRRRLAAHGGRLLRKHDAELAQEATDAVDGGGALLDQALAHSVHAQARLLVLALDWNEAHVRRCTASQIAVASAASVLPRLPLIRYGATNVGACL